MGARDVHEASCRAERCRVAQTKQPAIMRVGGAVIPDYPFDDAAAAKGAPPPPMSKAEMKSIIAQIHSGKKAHEVKLGEPGTKETEPPAKAAEQTAATSAGEATAPSAAGHSWDHPAPHTAPAAKQQSDAERMKENGGGVTRVNVNIEELPDEEYKEENQPRAKVGKKAAARAAVKGDVQEEGDDVN